MPIYIDFELNFSFMLISIQGVKCLSSSCPDGWERLEGHCYLWPPTESSWAAAEQFCNYQDGHLASVTTEEIHMYMRYKVNIVDGLGDVWVGGSDKEEGGVWTWTDGSAWNFTRWATKPVRQPDGKRLCLGIYHKLANDGWHDWPCHDKQRFVSCLILFGQHLLQINRFFDRFVCARPICPDADTNIVGNNETKSSKTK